MTINDDSNVTKRETRSKRFTTSKITAHTRDNLSVKIQGKKLFTLAIAKKKFITFEKFNDDDHESVVFIDDFFQKSRLILYRNKERTESLAHL